MRKTALKINLLIMLVASFLADIYLTIFSFDNIWSLLLNENGVSFDETVIGKFIDVINDGAFYKELFSEGEYSIGYVVIAIIVLLAVAVVATVFYRKIFQKRTMWTVWLAFIIPAPTIMMPFYPIICLVFFILFTVFAIKDIRKFNER